MREGKTKRRSIEEKGKQLREKRGESLNQVYFGVKKNVTGGEAKKKKRVARDWERRKRVALGGVSRQREGKAQRQGGQKGDAKLLNPAEEPRFLLSLDGK